MERMSCWTSRDGRDTLNEPVEALVKASSTLYPPPPHSPLFFLCIEQFTKRSSWRRVSILVKETRERNERRDQRREGRKREFLCTGDKLPLRRPVLDQSSSIFPSLLYKHNWKSVPPPLPFTDRWMDSFS